MYQQIKNYITESNRKRKVNLKFIHQPMLMPGLLELIKKEVVDIGLHNG